jgi:bifunctional N-acetylglucosamine-1-phosphate-uridyltransferase/glucosamine-1-phosphate-acetyltransferase GlmU-like protein
MIIGNNKPIVIIGYLESSMTMEFQNEIGKTHSYKVLTPEQFCELEDPTQYQFIVAVWKLNNRRNIIEKIDSMNLDLITVIHDSVVLGVSKPPSIGAGTFIFPFCTVLLDVKIGRHCIIASHCHIGHFCTVGDNCQIRPGTIINGKSKVGNNCTLNTRVTVTNKSTVGDNIELLSFTNVVKNLSDPGIYVGPTAKKFTGLSSPNDD